MSRVSVVVPCYRYGHLLEQCVWSVLTQADVDVEVLIVDDASPDGSGEVAKRLGRTDARVEVVHHRENHGHISTYNEGFAWASGDYVVLLSADDCLTPGALARDARVLDAHPDVGLAYGTCIIHWSLEPYAGPVATGRGFEVVDGRAWIAERCRLAFNPIFSAEAIVRRTVQVEVGPYRAEFPHSADHLNWLSIAAVSDVAFLHAQQAVRRLHGDNMGERHRAFAAEFWEEERAVYAQFFAERGRNLPDADRLSEVVTRNLARRAIYQASVAYQRGRADKAVVGALEAFARETDPSSRWSRQQAGLLVRKALGASAVSTDRALG